MHFAYHQPTGELAAFVKTIWTARGERHEFASADPIVPDGCVEMVFNLADPFRNGEVQPPALLAGQMLGPVVVVPTGAVDLIGVRFWPGRAGAALRVPMWELQDQLIDVSAVAGGLDRVADDLRNIDRDERLEHLCYELARRFESPAPRFDAAVDRALEIIAARRGNVAVDRIAASLAISRRHLERRFRDQVGLPAKQMARIARVHAVLRLLHDQPLAGGAEIAAACGYSDQPHMIRDCKEITGQTPARLMSTGRSLAGLLREDGRRPQPSARKASMA